MKRIVNALSKLNWGKRACAVLGLCATTAISLPAQIATLTTLYRFVCYQNVCPDGAGSKAGLVQTTNGGLYGTTYGGGANGYGTVFRITPGGTLTTLYSFCSQTNCADGSGPVAELVQAANGSLYGTKRDNGVWGGRWQRWDDLQNHPEWHADHTLQLLLPAILQGRRKPRSWARPGRQWGLLRDNA